MSKSNLEIFMASCDESGRPKMDTCPKCKKEIPILRIAHHKKMCGVKVVRSTQNHFQSKKFTYNATRTTR